MNLKVNALIITAILMVTCMNGKPAALFAEDTKKVFDAHDTGVRFHFYDTDMDFNFGTSCFGRRTTTGSRCCQSCPTIPVLGSGPQRPETS